MCASDRLSVVQAFDGWRAHARGTDRLKSYVSCDEVVRTAARRGQGSRVDTEGGIVAEVAHGPVKTFASAKVGCLICQTFRKVPTAVP